MSGKDLLVEEYRAALIIMYFSVGSAVLLFYDFILTFVSEIQRVWRRKFSGAVVIFLLIRYTTLLNRIVLILELQPWSETTSIEVCKLLDRSTDTLTIVSGTAATLMLALRVYVIWDRKWAPFLLVAVLGLVAPALRILQTLGTSVGFEELLNLGQCTETSASWVSVMQTPTFRVRRELANMASCHTSIQRFLLRDGTMYFILSLSSAVVNLLYTLKLPSFLDNKIADAVCLGFWVAFSPVFTTIILSRFILALREIYYSDAEDECLGDYLTLPRSESRAGLVRNPSFSCRLIGNLGATVDACYDDHVDADASGPEHERMEERPTFSSDPFATGLKDSVPVRSARS
ncbi:hypothetical protein C8Q80DRAFT_1267308 [Daedaleopsis nitida]|nr:hypothetical protein C8Q80DRAFT_1267308 [Daedaleopsis nitida]